MAHITRFSNIPNSRFVQPDNAPGYWEHDWLDADDIAWVAQPRKMIAADIGLGEPCVVFPLDPSCEGTLWR